MAESEGPKRPQQAELGLDEHQCSTRDPSRSKTCFPTLDGLAPGGDTIPPLR